ncbi:thiopurine S-methyltransferase [Hyphomicrobium sp.]|uniref:thiopurine S-methyltransferase n=1 Tax=Hyphomicrobium sp. TaxID=82 RepID=UPI000FBEF90E|nr:thiopurine S-methyltransferase [Hyphomicrobium sp.]RUP08519.1 MAG: thiopurine S-methyltransferase [Hyphomicrobium sp.]
MDKAFWHERWQRREIGFHQQRIHALLSRFWPQLGLPQGSAVFVPLAGKSRDMAWLATQGHRVIGVELSDVAVREFFEEAGLVPDRSSAGVFEIFSAGPFALYCGDFFELTADDLKDVVAVYDRAALIALPPQMRAAYAEALARILPRAAIIFLIAIDYPEGEITGPPFAVPSDEVLRLYGDNFEIEVLESRDGLADSDNLKKRGVTRLAETVYLLRRRS